LRGLKQAFTIIFLSVFVEINQPSALPAICLPAIPTVL